MTRSAMNILGGQVRVYSFLSAIDFGEDCLGRRLCIAFTENAQQFFSYDTKDGAEAFGNAVWCSL